MTGVDMSNIPVNTDRDRAEQFYMFLSFWLGAVIYGIYAILFVFSIRITLKDKRAPSANVFFISMFVMFVLTTIYTGINVHRFTQAFLNNAAPEGLMPVYYLRNYTLWDNFAFVVIMDMLVWLADALVIYRCFLIWSHNFYIIIIPCILLVISVVINSTVLVWFKHPLSIPFERILPFLNMVFPINIAQSCLTTGSIAFKILRQYQDSRKAGLFVSSGFNLITITRIIVESALIFTIQQILLLILYYANSPVQLLLHGTLVPSIGIIFVLIAIRTYAAKNADSFIRWPQRSSLVISPYNPRDGSTGPSNSRQTHASSIAFVRSVTVDQRRSHVLDMQPEEVKQNPSELELKEKHTILSESKENIEKCDVGVTELRRQ